MCLLDLPVELGLSVSGGVGIIYVLSAYWNFLYRLVSGCFWQYLGFCRISVAGLL